MKSKKTLIITSLVILLPCLVGILMWNRLPDTLPTHWGISGEADGWGSKGFAVFGIPLMFLAFQLIVCAVSRLDKQNQTGSNKRVLDMILYIFPIVSLMTSATMYSAALGNEFRITPVMTVLIGLLLTAIGNYLPKCRQNSTLGIKLKWTFHNEENWNKTHRIGGMVWVVCGLCIIVSGLLGWTWMVLPAFLAMILIPTVYSWLLYRKQIAAGTVVPGNPAIQISPKMKWVSWVLIAGILVLLFVVMFTGSVEVTLAGNTMSIETGFWNDLTVELGTIESVEYHPEGIPGSREWGYGSARLLLGQFYNEELGNYTRYSYVQTEGCILIRAAERWLVLNADSEDATQALYASILARVG